MNKHLRELMGAGFTPKMEVGVSSGKQSIDRRRFLKQVGAVGLAAGAPGLTRAAQDTTASPAMQALSVYMSEALQRRLPDDTAEHAKQHLLDTLAAMVSGSELAPGQAALRYVRTFASKGSATIVGSDLTAAPIDAALANGVLAQADETDDSHSRSRSHPGCAIVPAALAAGEQFGTDGTRFLRAVALGYDVGTRVTMAMGGVAFYNRADLSTHAIAGVFGAAAAAGSQAELDARQMRWLLDYSAQQSSGLAAWRRDVDHIEKAFVFAGMPARSGVTSALLVKAGWNGVDDLFSGRHNFFAAYAPAGNPSLLSEGLGERYEISQTDIKKWTVGTPIQGALDGVDAILKRRPFDADDVRQVVVRLAPPVAAIVDNRDIPDICLQHMIAVMLLDKTVSFKAAHDKQRMQDARVLSQRAKVQLVRDEALSRFLPARVTDVQITLADGIPLAERVEAVRGTPRNPMSSAEIIAKARNLIEPVLGPSKSAHLIDTVFAIEKLVSVRNLRPLLQTT